MVLRLTELPIGGKARIISIDAGRKAELNLMNLGLNIGNIIQLSRKSFFQGPVVVNFRGTEIAVGYGLSKKIMVSQD